MRRRLKPSLLMLSLALGLLTGLVAAWLHGFYDGGLRYVIERSWYWGKTDEPQPL